MNSIPSESRSKHHVSTQGEAYKARNENAPRRPALSLKQPQENPNLSPAGSLERGFVAKLLAQEIDELAEFLFVAWVEANEIFVRIQNDPLSFIVADRP